eukprot:14333590-Ditylum_brightwellii.AAC.1
MRNTCDLVDDYNDNACAKQTQVQHNDVSEYNSDEDGGGGGGNDVKNNETTGEINLNMTSLMMDMANPFFGSG